LIDEIATLAADLRAALEADRALGRWTTAEPALPEASPEAAPSAPSRPARPSAAPPAVAAPPASPPPKARAPAAPRPTEPPAASAWTALASAARTQADSGAETTHQVREALGACTRCGLARTRTHLVFGVGDPQADLLILGEAPGFHEDQRGEPFVGEAGQMLDRMLLGVLGLERSEVYICNVVKCRPPDNRDPAPEEIAACSPFLRRQILAVRPKVILIVGRVAMEALLGLTGIKRHRGQWQSWEGIPVLPTFHPAYLLRQADDKRLAFEDLKALSRRYDAVGGRRKRPAPFA
jgi:DNA polymerase